MHFFGPCSRWIRNLGSRHLDRSCSLFLVALLALGHLFLVADVAGCLVFLAAVCFVLLAAWLVVCSLTGLGAWVVWLGCLLLAGLVVWLCFACFVGFASKCDLPVLAVGWFCIA